MGWFFDRTLAILERELGEVRVYIYSKSTDVATVRELKRRIRPIRRGAGLSSITIKHLANVGRCDETYMHHMISTYRHRRNRMGVFLFLKDSTPKDMYPFRSAKLVRMVKRARTDGFAPNPDDHTATWEEGGRMADYQISGYSTRSTQNSTSAFVRAVPRGLGKWVRRHVRVPRVVRAVSSGKGVIAYTGVFACRMDVVHHIPLSALRRMRVQLRKGDNVEAGHYVERLWGILLTPTTTGGG
jgi:hypothetical protein